MSGEPPACTPACNGCIPQALPILSTCCAHPTHLATAVLLRVLPAIWYFFTFYYLAGFRTGECLPAHMRFKLSRLQQWFAPWWTSLWLPCVCPASTAGMAFYLPRTGKPGPVEGKQGCMVAQLGRQGT